MPLSAEVTLHVLSRFSATSDLGSVLDSLDQSYGVSFTNGAGVNQANMPWHDRRTLGSGATEDIDLAGVLTSSFGAVITFTEVKAIIIRALPTNTVNLTVTRPAANGVPFLLAAGDGFVLKPGGLFVLADPSDAGIAVTPATGDLITITSGAASSTYDIIIIGVV